MSIIIYTVLSCLRCGWISSREVDMYLHILLTEEYKTFGTFRDLFFGPSSGRKHFYDNAVYRKLDPLAFGRALIFR